MQKLVKRGNAWRIQVKYKHLRDAATKDTSQECIQWAYKRLMELQLEYEKQLKNLDKPQYTVKQLFNIYYEKIGQFTALLHKDLKCKAPLIEPNLRRNLGKWST